MALRAIGVSRNSLKKYEEKDLLALTGLSFDGLRSKMYIEEGVVAQGFIIYLDEEHPNIIELCFNSRKKADFEIFFKKNLVISNHK